MSKKVILISGGSDGIGKEIARTVSKEHSVIILAPNIEKLQNAAKEVNCEYEVCDVSSWPDVQTAVKHVLDKHKRIDVLINNAGLWIEGELDSNDPERIERVLEVNTLGTILLSKACIPTMKQQKSGLIINVISQSGLYTKPLRTTYAASKWAVTGFTKSLQQELSNYGIGVTGFYPGKVRTKLFEKAGHKRDLSSDAIDAQEVAKTIAFIISLELPTVIPEIGIKHILG